MVFVVAMMTTRTINEHHQLNSPLMTRTKEITRTVAPKELYAQCLRLHLRSCTQADGRKVIIHDGDSLHE
jgi:hypothetical protein